MNIQQQEKLITASHGLNLAIKRVVIYQDYQSQGVKVQPALVREAWDDAMHYAEMVAEAVGS